MQSSKETQGFSCCKSPSKHPQLAQFEQAFTTELKKMKVQSNFAKWVAFDNTQKV